MRPDHRPAAETELRSILPMRRTAAPLEQGAALEDGAMNKEISQMANPAPGYATKPEHRVDLLPETRQVRVTLAGTVIADSSATLRVEETGHQPVHYFPEKDVRLDLLKPTEHKTYCPFKGECSYWTIEL